MKLRIEKSAVVITPSIAKKSLVKAVESVENQTYQNLTHLVVLDGPDLHLNPIEIRTNNKLKLTHSPYNTGTNGFYGHRILAAYPHLVDHDYILFLDDDNWFDKDHVRSLIDLCEEKNLDFAHSLRKVYVNGEFLADDCCESIGRWPIAWTKSDHLVDTSSYCFRREWLIQYCHLWHSGWGGDRRFFHAVKDRAKYDTTGLHTLHYELPDMNKAYGGQTNIFEKYNELVKQTYGEYPWKKT
jgi:glycosyltransferase involved in cell wall biosynthesis